MSVRIALVGNVDHGKSTVIGRLLADTGQMRGEREAKVRSLCESSGRRFEYAFLLDALEEEQAQGITIDVTEVRWRHGGREFLFVDTPGHREFLKKMVGGASGVDAAVLLLDAAEGMSETFRRQLRVLELLGIRKRLVVLNKMDLVGWSEKAWRERQEEVRRHLQGEGVEAAATLVIPAAAWEGENLVRRSEKMPWYGGPTLAEALAALPPAPSLAEGPVRFWVQDVYRRDDRRIYVGRLESGRLARGDLLQFAPSGARARVKAIEAVAGPAPDFRAAPGDAVGLVLDEALYLDRGCLGYSPSQPPRSGHALSADFFWLHEEPLRAGTQVEVKCGPHRAVATVEAIEHAFDAVSWEKQQGAEALGLFGRARLRFAEPCFHDHFADCEPLGRFVACIGGRVLGGGRWAPDGRHLFAEPSSVRAGERARRARHAGLTVWLTGLSGSGKSTLARALERSLFDEGLNAAVLDGDNLRQGLCSDLGFSPADRDENLRRAAEVARLMTDTGLIVLTAFISPLARQRERARAIVGSERFLEVFVDCPLEECERRDSKGLYRKARAGELAEFTGISSPFERPASPGFTIATHNQGAEPCARLLLGEIRGRLERK